MSSFLSNSSALPNAACGPASELWRSSVISSPRLTEQERTSGQASGGNTHLKRPYERLPYFYEPGRHFILLPCNTARYR
jgi:hypothetical protein